MASGGLLAVLSGAAARGTVDDGTVTVESGGSAANIRLASGASLILSSGAAASGGTVLSGATLIIPNGVVASNVTVAPGGSMWVQLGGSAIGTVDSGGVTVASGGLASGGTIASGGSELLQQGGTAAGETIGAQGAETVASGGAISDATISGGVLEFAQGAIASGTIDFVGSGGSLVIDGVTAPAATIEGWNQAAGNAIDLRGFGGSPSLEVGDGSLTVAAGGSSTVLALAGVAAGETVSEQSDGDGGVLLGTPQASAPPSTGSTATSGPALPTFTFAGFNSPASSQALSDFAQIFGTGAGLGANSFIANGSGAIPPATGTTDTLIITGGTSTIVPVGYTAVWDTNSGDTVVAGMQDTDFYLQDNGPNVMGTTLFLGSGDDFVQAGGQDTIFGGSGADTIHGGAGNVDVTGGTGDLTFVGGQGAAWVSGGTGNMILSVDRVPLLRLPGGSGRRKSHARCLGQAPPCSTGAAAVALPSLWRRAAVTR